LTSMSGPSNPALEPRSVGCPLCQSEESHELYRSERPFMRIVRCVRCGMMFQNPRVVETEMPDAYEIIEGYRRFAEQDGAKRQLFGTRIERFGQERALPAAGSFLDLGAARGIMLDCMAQRFPGWQLAAVELSPSARAALAGRGYQVAASLAELPAELRFDWINIDNVLEHLPDPCGVLMDLKSRLKPGGFIYIEVPNESFFTIRYRINDFVRGSRKLPTAEGHVNLFTPRSLVRLFSATGFDCERFWIESVAMSHRLKGALGADETPRIRRVLGFLRATRLDVALRAGYFLCARIEPRGPIN
jgi:SAM-dependent methyltransferase